MSAFYENVLLREEFNLVQKLQKDTEFAKYVTVQYEDRVTGKTETVLSAPAADKYPEIYVVDYRMPVYVGVGQLQNDYHATARIILSKPVLENRRADRGPSIDFQCNYLPFNNHIKKEWRTGICDGNAWEIAKDHGLWHYIISLGAIINQDSFVCSEGGHFNKDAYDYWVRRDRKPVTNIQWPLDLLTKPTITVTRQTVTPATTIEKPKITIVKKIPGQQQVPQPVKKITIIKK